MRGKPSISQFILSAAADVADATDVADKAERPVVVKETKSELTVPISTQKAQRSVRLPLDLCLAVRDRAYTESKEKGIRVTEQDIFEQALRKFFK